MSSIEIDSTFSESDNGKKPGKIFEIKKYNFLKQKRHECITNEQKISPWTEEEDSTLKDTIYKYSDLSWKIIAKKLQNRTAIQCMSRWKMQLAPNVKKGKWTKEEDELMLNLLSENKDLNWNNISKNIEGRTSKQIRERYINHISLLYSNKEKIQFKWNDKLDRMLLEKYIILGSNWVNISKMIPGTTENMVKNRFYSLLRQCVNKIKKKKKDKVDMIGSEIDNDINTNVIESGFDTNKGISHKKMILNGNPYVTCSKSLKKNYSLKILIEFLPELLEDKGIDIDEVKGNKGSEDEIKIKKEKAVKLLFNFLKKFMEKNMQKKELQIHITGFKEKVKSPKLMNMQICQLGIVFDKIERLKFQIMRKYFDYLKGRTVSQECIY